MIASGTGAMAEAGCWSVSLRRGLEVLSVTSGRQREPFAESDDFGRQVALRSEGAPPDASRTTARAAR